MSLCPSDQGKRVGGLTCVAHTDPGLTSICWVFPCKWNRAGRAKQQDGFIHPIGRLRREPDATRCQGIPAHFTWELRIPDCLSLDNVVLERLSLGTYVHINNKVKVGLLEA